MQKSTGSYEKIILTLAAVAAIAVAAYLVMLSNGLDQDLTLPQATERNIINAPDNVAVTNAITVISKKYSWVSPVINNKPVPLNKSVLLVMQKGKGIFDLFVADPVFRAPMPNLLLIGDKSKSEDQLPHIFSPNVGQLDADEDGFWNEEEFLAKTNPRDPKSMPLYVTRLALKQRISNDYILKLASGDDGGTFQIRRIKPEPPKGVFATLNTEFGFDRGVNRFVALSFTKKKINHPTLGEKDVYVLKMRDNATNSEFELVEGVETNLAEYEAQFEFRYKVLSVIPNVKKGKTFQLPVGESYIVDEIEENKASIRRIIEGKPGGPKIEILRN